MVGVTCSYCNASSSAYANGSIYNDTFPGTIVTSITSAAGQLQWAGSCELCRSTRRQTKGSR